MSPTPVVTGGRVRSKVLVRTSVDYFGACVLSQERTLMQNTLFRFYGSVGPSKWTTRGWGASILDPRTGLECGWILLCPTPFSSLGPKNFLREGIVLGLAVTP